MDNPDIVSRFGEIYDATRRQVLAYITSKCRYTDDISDIFQETYMDFYRVLNNRGEGHVKCMMAYIMNIARRKIARHYTLLERLKLFVPMTVEGEEGEYVELTDFVPDSFLLEDFAINQLMVEAAWQYLKQKPQEVKKVFYLYFEAGLKITEIAEALGLTESNVKNKLYRTLKELREYLT